MNITDINFNVTVHFSNGVTMEREVPLGKAVKLSMKENVIVPPDTDIIEIRGVSSTLVVPVSMTFVVQASPDLRHTNKVSKYMLYKRDKGMCGYCAKELSMKEATVDHILPKSQGGKTIWGNVALACKKCNNKKDSKTPAQAGMKLLVKPYNPKKVSKKGAD